MHLLDFDSFNESATMQAVGTLFSDFLTDGSQIDVTMSIQGGRVLLTFVGYAQAEDSFTEITFQEFQKALFRKLNTSLRLGIWTTQGKHTFVPNKHGGVNFTVTVEQRTEGIERMILDTIARV